VNMLSSLNPLHLRVLSAAWRKANQKRARAGTASPQDVLCTAEEMNAMAGVAHVESIEWIVNDLHTFGLLGNTARPELGEKLAQVNLSLSELGAQLCERCFGQPDAAEEETQPAAILEQFVPLDNEESSPGNSSEELSYSLASEAETLRQDPGVALLD
jgi:hypothetical protein